MVILGIWDGHDAGAALLVDGSVAAAVNEERLTRRKLEIRFPDRSIATCLEMAALPASAVASVAASTCDPAKTLGRWLPATKEAYYAVRRRKTAPGLAASLKRAAKLRITEWPPNRLSHALSLRILRRELHRTGLDGAALSLHDHHRCHAVAAALGSGWPTCLVVTLDGLGDGLSATVSVWRDSTLTRLAATPARHSIGVFFEHVTNLLNMRELEDEGKVMALADHAAPVPDERNPMLELFRVERLELVSRLRGFALQRWLKRLLWFHPNEQFAYMAQRAIQRACVSLIEAAVADTGIRRVALAGGVASNIKMNREVRLLEAVEDVYVFPHMGDGGLALGAAVDAAASRGEPVRLVLDDLGLGPSFTETREQAALASGGLTACRPANLAGQVADLLAAGKVVLWYQGAMEYGPRALGHRSVLARPDRVELRDRLNLLMKRRVWFQPFCPSLLEDDARRLFADWKGRPDRYMTMGYLVKPECRGALAGVISVDGTCRPQIVSESSQTSYADVLRQLRNSLGVGAVLNTSFNIHGDPLVCTPEEAVSVYEESGADALAMGPFLVRRR